MEEVEGKQLTTERGKQVVFKFELIPSDMKWMSSHSRELNNCATYFSPFANVNQTSKRTIGGTNGDLEATWQPWDYTETGHGRESCEVEVKTSRSHGETKK